MGFSYTESELEESMLKIFQAMGYEYRTGINLNENGDRNDFESSILKSRLSNFIYKNNKKIPIETLEEAIRTITYPNSPILIENNKTFQKYLVEGIPVEYIDKDGNTRGDLVKIIDEVNIENNDFLIANQVTFLSKAKKINRRPDLIVYINGIPISVIELKSSSNEDVGIEDGYNQLQTYKNEIPQLFETNSFMITSDGIDARIGTLTSEFTRFMPWKSIAGEEAHRIFELDTMIKGVFEKKRVLDILRNFILFQTDGEKSFKIIAGYHQYFAVKKAIESTKIAVDGDRRAGVVWHTQGSGKSLSMVFYASEIIRALGNPTILILTDRNDLDDQLFSTFSKSIEILRQTPIQAETTSDLREKLTRESGGIIFSTIQKFILKSDEDKMPILSNRENIVVIVDEAHRTQYGMEAKVKQDTGDIVYGYAKHVRDAIPNSTFIGFTGTPIDTGDKSTRGIFGNYIDVYDMTQSVEDGATVKVYYENRIATLKLNEDMLYKIDNEYESMIQEGAEEELIEKSKKEFAKMEQIVGDEDRLKMLAEDIVVHYEDRENIMSGKAMIVCMSRKIAVNLYNQIIKFRPNWKIEDKIRVIMTGNAADSEKLKEHYTTKMEREELGKRMKSLDDSLKIVIVVDMWLTGFDVPSLSTMYIDKPMQSHNLMQAIARVNRVFKDKEGGLVVDYIGIMDSLKEALNTYTSRDRENVELDLKSVKLKIETILEQLDDIFYKCNYEKFFSDDSSARLDAIVDGIDHILALEHENNGAKKQFLTFVAELTAGETLARALLTERERVVIAYFKSVKAGIVKISQRKELNSKEINNRVANLVKASIQKDMIIDLSDILGIEEGALDIFDENFLSEIKNMKRKNMGLEILEKLLGGKIKSISRQNIVQSKKFSDRMKEIMNQYTNKALTNAEVIEELIKMSRELKNHFDEMDSLGLSRDEIAFYDALTNFEGVKDVMKEDILKDLAKELVQKIRSSRTIDWKLKESAKAEMRKMVKRLLKKYGYPPKNVEKAVEIVIEQVEQYSEEL